MRLGQLIWTNKGILHTKFQGLKVCGTPFSHALFVFNSLTVENPLKMSPNQRTFSIKRVPKIERFQLLTLE